MELKCFDHNCGMAERCAWHAEGEPDDGAEWMWSLFPYDVSVGDDCPWYEPNGEDDL